MCCCTCRFGFCLIHRTILEKAKQLKKTKKGLEITCMTVCQLPTNSNLQKARNKASEDYKLILTPPYSNVDKVVDHVYLTGIGGLTKENITDLRITCVINATYESPQFQIHGIEAIRIPVDDDGDEHIYVYFDEVADQIDKVSKSNGNTVVHCLAGVSRSSTLVIAYLIKHCNMSLRKAFDCVKKARSVSLPNEGFIKQLIDYEKKIRKTNSVHIVKEHCDGIDVYVPDFYKKHYPVLYTASVMRQKERFEENRDKQTDRKQSQSEIKPTKTAIKPDITKLQTQIKPKKISKSEAESTFSTTWDGDDDTEDTSE